MKFFFKVSGIQYATKRDFSKMTYRKDWIGYVNRKLQSKMRKNSLRKTYKKPQRSFK
jgi:hypothetical protein